MEDGPSRFKMSTLKFLINYSVFLLVILEAFQTNAYYYEDKSIYPGNKDSENRRNVLNSTIYNLEFKANSGIVFGINNIDSLISNSEVKEKTFAGIKAPEEYLKKSHLIYDKLNSYSNTMEKTAGATQNMQMVTLNIYSDLRTHNSLKGATPNTQMIILKRYRRNSNHSEDKPKCKLVENKRSLKEMRETDRFSNNCNRKKTPGKKGKAKLHSTNHKVNKQKKTIVATSKSKNITGKFRSSTESSNDSVENALYDLPHDSLKKLKNSHFPEKNGPNIHNKIHKGGKGMKIDHSKNSNVKQNFGAHKKKSAQIVQPTTVNLKFTTQRAVGNDRDISTQKRNGTKNIKTPIFHSASKKPPNVSRDTKKISNRYLNKSKYRIHDPYYGTGKSKWVQHEKLPPASRRLNIFKNKNVHSSKYNNPSKYSKHKPLKPQKNFKHYENEILSKNNKYYPPSNNIQPFKMKSLANFKANKRPLAKKINYQKRKINRNGKNNVNEIHTSSTKVDELSTAKIPIRLNRNLSKKLKSKRKVGLHRVATVHVANKRARNTRKLRFLKSLHRSLKNADEDILNEVKDFILKHFPKRKRKHTFEMLDNSQTNSSNGSQFTKPSTGLMNEIKDFVMKNFHSDRIKHNSTETTLSFLFNDTTTSISSTELTADEEPSHSSELDIDRICNVTTDMQLNNFTMHGNESMFNQNESCFLLERSLSSTFEETENITQSSAEHNGKEQVTEHIRRGITISTDAQEVNNRDINTGDLEYVDNISATDNSANLTDMFRTDIENIATDNETDYDGNENNFMSESTVENGLKIKTKKIKDLFSPLYTSISTEEFANVTEESTPISESVRFLNASNSYATKRFISVTESFESTEELTSPSPSDNSRISAQDTDTDEKSASMDVENSSENPFDNFSKFIGNPNNRKEFNTKVPMIEKSALKKSINSSSYDSTGDGFSTEAFLIGVNTLNLGEIDNEEFSAFGFTDYSTSSKDFEHNSSELTAPLSLSFNSDTSDQMNSSLYTTISSSFVNSSNFSKEMRALSTEQQSAVVQDESNYSSTLSMFLLNSSEIINPVSYITALDFETTSNATKLSKVSREVKLADYEKDEDYKFPYKETSVEDDNEKEQDSIEYRYSETTSEENEFLTNSNGNPNTDDEYIEYDFQTTTEGSKEKFKMFKSNKKLSNLPKSVLSDANREEDDEEYDYKTASEINKHKQIKEAETTSIVPSTTTQISETTLKLDEIQNSSEKSSESNDSYEYEYEDQPATNLQISSTAADKQSRHSLKENHTSKNSRKEKGNVILKTSSIASDSVSEQTVTAITDTYTSSTDTMSVYDSTSIVPETITHISERTLKLDETDNGLEKGLESYEYEYEDQPTSNLQISSTAADKQFKRLLKENRILKSSQKGNVILKTSSVISDSASEQTVTPITDIYASSTDAISVSDSTSASVEESAFTESTDREYDESDSEFSRADEFNIRQRKNNFVRSTNGNAISEIDEEPFELKGNDDQLKEEEEYAESNVTYIASLKNSKIMPVETTTTYLESRGYKIISDYQGTSTWSEDYQNRNYTNEEYDDEMTYPKVNFLREVTQLNIKDLVENGTPLLNTKEELENSSKRENGLSSADVISSISYGNIHSEMNASVSISAVPEAASELEGISDGDVRKTESEMEFLDETSTKYSSEKSNTRKTKRAKNASSSLEELKKFLNSLINRKQMEKRNKYNNLVNHRKIRRTREVINIEETTPPIISEERTSSVKGWLFVTSGLLIISSIISGIYLLFLKHSRKNRKYIENLSSDDLEGVSVYDSTRVPTHLSNNEDEMGSHWEDDGKYLCHCINEVLQKFEITETEEMKNQYPILNHTSKIDEVISGNVM